MADKWEDAPGTSSAQESSAGWEDAPQHIVLEKSFVETAKPRGYQAAVEGSRAQFIKPGSPLSGTAFETGLGIAEQVPAIAWGLGSQAYAGVKAGVKASIAKAVGLPFGEVFKEEFDKIAENAADAYVPLTPAGELFSSKISELMGKGIHGAGGLVFEKGLPTFGPIGIIAQGLGVVKGPGAGSPAVAAATEGAITLAMLMNFGGKAKPGVPREPGPLEVWNKFKANYPESAKAIDSSSLGAVRFRREDTSIMDAVTRQMNTELGLQGSASDIPFKSKAALVFNKVAPEVPLAEKLKATAALEKKIQVLDEARVALSDARGLPAPRPGAISEEPITVAPSGLALTHEQGLMLDDAFRAMVPEQRADAIGQSAMGQLRLQAEKVGALSEAGGPTFNMESRSLDRMWNDIFAGRDRAKVAAGLEAFKNFDGKMSWDEAVAKVGPPVQPMGDVLGRRYWQNKTRMRQSGAIDIEGIDYLLNSFLDLPNKPLLKRATIVGMLNRQGVPEAEKQVVLRALRDQDTITQPELVARVTEDILPLKLRDMGPVDTALGDYGVGLDRVGAKEFHPEDAASAAGDPRAPTVHIWQAPIRTHADTHFGDPQYFGHTRVFDSGIDPVTFKGLQVMQDENFSKFGVYTRDGDLVSPKFYTLDAAKEWKDAQQPGVVRTIGELQSNLTQEINKAMRDPMPKESMGLDKMPPETLKKVLSLSKRGYERLLMEENRQAARDGVERMRVATADTTAKVQYWNPGLKDGTHPILFEYDVSGYPTKFDKAIVRNGILQYVQAGDGLRLSPSREVVNGVMPQLPKGDLPPNLKTIYDFYKNEVAFFTRARWGAKEVMDAQGNTWMEWRVRPEAAEEKIPAFGGRRPEAPGPIGKQRGAIDIPEYEDFTRGVERGQQATEQALKRGWTVPGAASDELYKKTKDAFERSRVASEEGMKMSMRDIGKRVREKTITHDYDLRNELLNAGPYGQAARDRLVLQNGATMAAKTMMDTINENIFHKMDSATKASVDELMRLRRIIEIDLYKGTGKHKHPEGITGPEAEAVAIRMKQELGDAKFAEVYGFTNQIIKEYKDILLRRNQAGLLSNESYLKLVHFDYSPTEFIDLIDPMQQFSIKGHKFSVRTSGVPYLERGKIGAVSMDSQLLLAEALVRSENLIFKNETTKALQQLASEHPENGIVAIPKKGMVGTKANGDQYLKHAPDGWTGVGVRTEGGQRFILMRNDMAEQFIRRPEPMDPFVSTLLRWGSGSQLLKATATTYNPTFVISGLPMDVLHTWLATSGDYSPHLPVFAGQMARDLTATALDAFVPGRKADPTGRYQTALKEGLGAAFMTHEGRGFSSSLNPVERTMLPHYDRLKYALSYVNESADIWARLAHRERLIREGMPSWQATARARDRLDYSVAGTATRAVDTVMPYTAVAVNALTKVVQAGVRDPVDLGIKVAWAGSAIAAWTTANIVSSPETWQQIPTQDKIRSLPITFSDQWFIMDPDGNKRYLYMPGVRLDAVAGPLAATIVAGLEAAEFGKTPDNILSKSFTNLNPVLEMQAPPIIEGIKTYLSNYDALTGRPVVGNMGKVLPQDESAPYGRKMPPSALSRAIGETTGMSPPRLEAAASKVINTNNLYLSMMGWAFKQVYEGANPREQAQAVEQGLVQNPAVRPFLKLTNPSTQYLAGIQEKDQAEGSRRKEMTDQVDNLLFEVRQGQATTKEVQAYISQRAPEDRQWLTTYALTGYKVKEVMKRFGASDGIPNETWWRAVAGLEPRPRAQEFYSQWLSAGPEDRRRMEGIAKGLHNAGVAFMSDSFKRELAKERELLGEEQR